MHEAYLKLTYLPQTNLRDHAHFLALSSRIMRNVLVDQARARRAAKRGAGAANVEFNDATWLAEEQVDAVHELDDALRRLEAVDERRSKILEQRYFGGLSLEETAEALGISLATVKRELRSARAWLAAELQYEAP